VTIPSIPEKSKLVSKKKKTVVILQSNYIPWKGYFDLINLADEFVLYDEVQYTKNDWRNRNVIKTKAGAKWLTIPVRVRRLGQRINETNVSDSRWNQKHWKTIETNYSKAAHFNIFKSRLRDLYLGCEEKSLSRINERFIREMCDIIGIKTRITSSAIYNGTGGKTDRLVDICKKAGATTYLSGPAAKTYINQGLFADVDIELSWMDYSDYPEYDQLYPPFQHTVSILDLILNRGSNAPNYMKSFI